MACGWVPEGAAGSLTALEALLSEEVLAGRGRLCQAELRPLAFSMLAELVHHARGHLSAAQLNHTVHIFCRYVFLRFQAIAVLTMSLISARQLQHRARTCTVDSPVPLSGGYDLTHWNCKVRLCAKV